MRFVSVNTGDYIQAVCDRNLAENISRVLYPNDNVSQLLIICVKCVAHWGNIRYHSQSVSI